MEQTGGFAFVPHPYRVFLDGIVGLLKPGGEDADFTSVPPFRSKHFAWQQSSGPNVRFGSKADMAACPNDVCFTPKSGHRLARLGHSKCDRSTSGTGHKQTFRTGRNDIRFQILRLLNKDLKGGRALPSSIEDWLPPQSQKPRRVHQTSNQESGGDHVIAPQNGCVPRSGRKGGV
jgi:hypothetical protein